jgi:chemotaxis protein MotB
MRKRPPEEHENSERWMVSYADFVTLLFAFFVVMYAISSVNAGKYRVLSTALVSAFHSGAPISLTTQATGGANSLIQVPDTKPIDKAVRSSSPLQEQAKLGNLAADLKRVMQSLVKSGQVSITQSSKGVVIEIKDSALFSSGQALPSAQSSGMMTRLATELALVDNSISVEGFTDNIPINNPVFPSNWELSAARAGSVVRLFQEDGIAAQRLVAIGRAANMPLASNGSADGRAQNRRVSITVLADSVDSNGQSLPVEQMKALQAYAASAGAAATPDAKAPH